jgi:TolB-like protein
MRSVFKLTHLFAAATALALPAVVAAQGNRPVVAVLEFTNASIGKDARDYDGLGKGIADLLITDMASNQKVRLVDRDRIQTVLQEQNLVKAGSIDPQTAVRVGKILGAQYAVVGTFMNVSGQMVLTGRTIDVETTEIANPQKVQAKGDDVLGLIGQLSSKLNNDIKLDAKPVRRTGDAGTESPTKAPAVNAGPAPQGKPVETKAVETKTVETKPPVKSAVPVTKVETFAKELPPQARSVKLDLATARVYSSALDEMDKKNSAKAAELFRQVVAKYPTFTPAKDNLEKVSKSGN